MVRVGHEDGNTRRLNPDEKASKEIQINSIDLEIIIENSGLAWWDQNFSTGKITRSKNWSTMLGYEPQEINADIEGWSQLIHPDDRFWVEQAVRKHESGQTPLFEVEHRMRTKDGKWKWILNWGKVIERDVNGKPVRAVGTHMDITCRKEIEIEKAVLIHKLENALKEIKILRGIIPICSHCKRIRDDKGIWMLLESYIQERSEAEFSHGMCPECIKEQYPDLYAKIRLDTT